MGNYRELLGLVSRNPTMMFWLDNNQNHGTAVNENWGRELLELFSLGAGNYTEVDVREASRAFTGWTFETKIPRAPTATSPGSSSIGRKTMTMARRSSSATRGGSTARTFSTSSCSSRPAANSSAATCITSSSRTNRRCRRGRSSRRRTEGHRRDGRRVPRLEVRYDCGAADMFNRSCSRKPASSTSSRRPRSSSGRCGLSADTRCQSPAMASCR